MFYSVFDWISIAAAESYRIEMIEKHTVPCGNHFSSGLNHSDIRYLNQIPGEDRGEAFHWAILNWEARQPWRLRNDREIYNKPANNLHHLNKGLKRPPRAKAETSFAEGKLGGKGFS